jgi:hypothetical protein
LAEEKSREGTIKVQLITFRQCKTGIALSAFY